MKSKRSLFLIVYATIALMFCCSSDDDTDFTPTQEAEEIEVPNEAYEVEGYRLILTDIYCEKSNDQNNPSSRNEFYGYIRAWAEYGNGYINSDLSLETNEKTILFYRYRHHWLGMYQGDTKSLDKSFDFYFNTNHVGKAYIHLDGWLKEKDPDEPDQEDDDYGYRTKEINVEDINLGMEYELRFDDAPSNKNIIKAKFKFEKFSINSDDLTYPESYGPGDNFNLSSGDYPPPTPSSYTSSIPLSKRYVILQQNPSKLYPRPNKVELLGTTSAYVYNQNPKFVSDSELIEPDFNILCEEVHHDDNCICLIEIDEDTKEATYGTQIVGTGPSIKGPKISAIPKMQIIQYWVPIEVWRIPAGTSKTLEVSYTHGWEETQEYGISVTLGYEAGVEGFGKLNTELQTSYNYSIAENYSKTETITNSCTAPDNKNVLYVTWQRINEIRLINNNGEIFNDENYYFSSMPIARVPADDIIDMAYQYNASGN